MGFPKNYNRNMAINLKGDAAADDYKLIASGILSRTNSISESKSSYQYMDNRGSADTDVTGQEVSAAFTGHRGGQPERLEGQGAASDHGQRQRQRGRPAEYQLYAQLHR